MPVIKFNENTIAQLSTPEGKKRIEYVDADFPGLYLEIRAGYPGKGTWYYRYASGQNKTMSHHRLGHSNKISLAEIRQMAGKVKAEIDYLGADPVAQEKARLAVIIFDEFFHEHYLPHVKPRKRSWNRDEELYRLRISTKFGKKRLNEVTRQQLQAFHSDLLAEPMAPASANHHLKLIRHMLNLAIDWEMLEKNVASKIPMFPEMNQKERFLSEEELARLVKVLKTDSCRTVGLIVLFLLSTGARVNEALSARWANIDKQRRIWLIPATNSKSKRDRSVPLSDSAMDVLNQLDTYGEFEHVFINRKTKKPFVNIAKVWAKLRMQADLPEMRLHDARHFFCSALASSGRTLYEIQVIAGHVDPKTTMRYSAVSNKALQSAANTASSLINKAIQQGATSVPPLVGL